MARRQAANPGSLVTSDSPHSSTVPTSFDQPAPAGHAPTAGPDVPAGPDRAGSGTRLRALDGVRGFALVGMLAWHAEVGWVRGGFARMTVFFVLAGFLATRSLLRLRDRQAARPFLRFWQRRFFRLMPMTLVGVALSVAVTAAIGGSRAREGVTGDTLSVLTSVSNWRFVLDERPYAGLFEAPNAFQHYWSLSVEEQSFLLLPLILAVTGAIAGALGRRGTGGDRRVMRRRQAVVLAVGGAVLAAGPLVVAQAPDLVYYGTHVRLGEFLAGVALAMALSARATPAWSPAARRWWDAGGLVSLALLATVMLTIERDQEWIYRGGMGLFAVPAALLVGAVVAGGRWVSAVLGVAPLAALGRWALSVYALHWPLYLLVERAAPRFGLEGAALSTVKLAGGVAVGAAGYRFVERPLMRARTAGGPTPVPEPLPAWPARAWPAWQAWWAQDRVAGRVVAGTMVLCLAAAIAVPPREPLVDLDAAVGEGPPLLSLEDAEAILAGMGPELPVFRNPEHTGVALFGGSGALMLAMGVHRWADQQATVEAVPGYSALGCSLLTLGERRGREGNRPGDGDRPNRPPEQCLEWTRRWPAAVKARRVDVAVVVSSTFDLNDWRLDADRDREWRSVGDPVLDAVLVRAMHTSADVLRQAGAREVVFVTTIEPPAGADTEENRRRAAAYNKLMREVAAERDDVRLLDYGNWTSRLDVDEFHHWLPDGIHTTLGTSADLWDGWLGNTLEAVVPIIPVRGAD